MESPNESISFFEKCRLCLNAKGYCVIHEVSDLTENIYNFTGVRVTKSDNLPTKICKPCLDVILNTVKLKTTAAKNDQYLRTLFNDDDSEKSQNTVDSTNNAEVTTSNATSTNKTNEAPNRISVRTDIFSSATPEVSSVKKETLNYENDKRVKVYENKKGELVFECKICSKKFEKWKKIYLHLRSHSKNYLCPLDACTKKFATKGDLEKHIRCHTGEKPFQCDECDSSFTQRGSLKVHKINVHNMAAP